MTLQSDRCSPKRKKEVRQQGGKRTQETTALMKVRMVTSACLRKRLWDLLGNWWTIQWKNC
ncbi:hypothetical protein NFI96_010371, partial [Prochilodus magdalenae]